MTNNQQQAIINQDLIEGDIKTTCPYCGVGCGISVSKPSSDSSSGLPVLINGDKRHPANFGKLCIKGKNLGETLDNNNRLATPMINNQAQKWPKTLDYVASKISESIKEHGKDSVGFYLSGQLLTEDYYIANKLMKGFVGSGNVDTNSRLCMSSAVSGHKRAFGEDIVPMSYSDITKADLIVLAGSNLAWCHPVLYQRIRDEKQKRPELKLVVIDPRVTASIELADLHLPIKAGRDVILFNGLLNYLNKEGFINQDLLNSIDKSVGLAQALTYAEQDSKLLDDINLSSKDIEQFYQLFANSDKVVTLFSQGINQSSQGTDQVNGIINAHLVTNKIGKEGCGPFSITGQPNAMGGREVGALANTLASHIEFKDSHLHEALADFWQTDNLTTAEGLKAVDLFDAVESGKIKVLWIMATNPLVSMPDHKKIKRALQKCEMVIVSDCVANNDTLAYANVILPTQTWGEKSGTVTNSERRISRQRPFLKPFEQAKSNWWIISEIAKRMGFTKQFNYQSVDEIFAEHARLSGLENNNTRAFDISVYGDLTKQQYQRWQPVQWPQPKGRSIRVSEQDFFTDGHYYHDNNLAKVVAIKYEDTNNEKSSDNSFTLNTGRNRDQWHTQTRSGKSSLLSQRHPEPELEINPDDALKLNIKNNQLVSLSADGISSDNFLIRAKVTKKQKPKELFVAIHWSSSNFNQGCVSQFINADVDKLSGQPAFKHSQVLLKACSSSSEAMLVVPSAIKTPLATYQVKQKIAGGYCYHLASDEQPEVLFKRLNDYLSEHEEFNDFDILNASEPSKHYFRKSYFKKEKLHSAVLVAKEKDDLPLGWISQVYNPSNVNNIKREFLSNDSKHLQTKQTFCHCLNININDIEQAITDGDITVASIRAKTNAGNGCGSCIGDISLLLNEA
ncbi:MAG: molybdopterin-dependent oxidoreductase [Colwellia sp.]